MMSTPNADAPIQPKVLKFLEGLRRKNKLVSGVQLVGLLAGKPDETILDVDSMSLRGDLQSISEDITTLLQQRANDRRASVRAQLVSQGEEPIFLSCRPNVDIPSLLPQRQGGRHEDDEGNPDVDSVPGYQPDEDPATVAAFTRGGLRHQGAIFALELYKQNQASIRLTLATSLHREARDARKIDQLERQIVRYQNIFEQAVLAREALLDRQAERQLEIDRVKQKDKWLQDGFAKIVSLVALHAPAIMEKFDVAIDPRAREMLYDIVGSVPAAKNYVNAMKMASSMAEQSNGHTNGASHGAAPTLPQNTQTTAGAIAQSTISGGGETVGAGALAVFSALTVQFLTAVKDKFTMVRPMLAAEHATLLDKIVELSEAHGAVFQAVGNAALQGQSQVKADGPSPTGEEDRKMIQFMDLCGTFFGTIRPADIEKMSRFLPTTACNALDEIQKSFDLSKLIQTSAN